MLTTGNQDAEMGNEDGENTGGDTSRISSCVGSLGIFAR